MTLELPIDDYEAASRLRAIGLPPQPIIAATAHAMATDREKRLSSGCDDYKVKQINRTKLIETMGNHLAGAAAASGDVQD